MPCPQCDDDQKKRGKRAPKRREVRVTFTGDNVQTSLWVYVCECETGQTLFTLQHDYPPDEFAPAIGWTIQWEDRLYEITAVDGRKLTCVD